MAIEDRRVDGKDDTVGAEARDEMDWGPLRETRCYGVTGAPDALDAFEAWARRFLDGENLGGEGIGLRMQVLASWQE